MKLSELRQDLVSGDWILLAPARGKKPKAYLTKKPRSKEPATNCPFEKFFKKGFLTNKPISAYPVNYPTVIIVPNQYPAVVHQKICANPFKKGIYETVAGYGYHDLVITRDHHQNFAQLSSSVVRQVLKICRDRYLMLTKDDCVAYVAIFHNWGPLAGATVYHPHWQIIAIPVVPPDVEHSLAGAAAYFRKNKKCVHCLMIKDELKIKKRLVAENETAVAFAPFVSREPFELRIFPKKHRSWFEETNDFELAGIADLFQTVLRKIKNKLNDPDYNFFIHTAPVREKKKYHYYHWHIEILPKFNISAGFELSTGIEINVIDPEEAAKILKNNDQIINC